MCRIPGQEGGALSSCKFPLMQTRSQVPGRISDRSVWAENHGPGQGTCFLFCKKHLYHPVGTCRGEGAVSFVVCATGAGTASEPLCWGHLYFSVRLRRQEALSALPGPWRSALSAIREVLPALGLDIVPATPDSWPAEPNVTGASGLREHPSLWTVNTTCCPGHPQGRLWSGHSGGGSYPPWMMLTCPARALGNRLDHSTS